MLNSLATKVWCNMDTKDGKRGSYVTIVDPIASETVFVAISDIEWNSRDVAVVLT